MVAGFLDFYCRAFICHLQPLGVADPDSTFSDHCVCEGDGYNVSFYFEELPRTKFQIKKFQIPNEYSLFGIWNFIF